MYSVQAIIDGEWVSVATCDTLWLATECAVGYRRYYARTRVVEVRTGRVI
jgi:hypothetical protein